MSDTSAVPSKKGKVEVDVVKFNRLKTKKVALQDALWSALVKIEGLMGSDAKDDADVEYIRRVLIDSKK